MLHVSGRATGLRLSILAGSAILMLGGLTAAAQAVPVGPMASAASGFEAVQYRGEHDAHPLHRHHPWNAYHRYGENYHPRHPGHAGIYDCGPGGHSTRLSRKSCGGIDRFRHLYHER